MGQLLIKIYNSYKIHLLASLTVAVALIALKVSRDPLTFTLLILGALLGTFVLDLDYMIYAFFIEPKKDFSTTVRAYIRHKDFANALGFIQSHKHEVTEKTLIGAIFQAILGGASLFVMSSNASLFIKALVISTFVNSIYRMWEYFFENKLEEWFWGVRIEMNKNKLIIYTLVLVGILGYSLVIFQL